MGSLILILLVMDRKAHQAAQARAQREAARLAEENAHNETARQAEREQTTTTGTHGLGAETRRPARQPEPRADRDCNCRCEKSAINSSAIAARLRYEQDMSTQLRHKVQGRARSAPGRRAILRTLRSTAEQTANQSKESSQSLQRMTLDLLQMEQVLKDLKAARQREQKTFSVVPYHGRRGENRRPLYIECTADGRDLPSRTQSDAGHLTPISARPRPTQQHADDVRAEVERRIAQQRAKAGRRCPPTWTKRRICCLLLRPGGITTYHLLQGRPQGLPLDFGYEFIDDDWVLDFPADDEQPSAQPWMAAAQASASPSAVPAVPSASSPHVGSIGLSPQQAAIASSGAIVQGIRTSESSGPMDVSEGRSFQTATGGTGPGASGPFSPGRGPGGTGTSVPGGVKYISSNGGISGWGAGGNASNGLPGLVVGPLSNRPGQAGGAFIQPVWSAGRLRNCCRILIR